MVSAVYLVIGPVGLCTILQLLLHNPSIQSAQSFNFRLHNPSISLPSTPKTPPDPHSCTIQSYIDDLAFECNAHTHAHHSSHPVLRSFAHRGCHVQRRRPAFPHRPVGHQGRHRPRLSPRQICRRDQSLFRHPARGLWRTPSREHRLRPARRATLYAVPPVLGLSRRRRPARCGPQHRYKNSGVLVRPPLRHNDVSLCPDVGSTRIYRHSQQQVWMDTGPPRIVLRRWRLAPRSSRDAESAPQQADHRRPHHPRRRRHLLWCRAFSAPTCIAPACR